MIANAFSISYEKFIYINYFLIYRIQGKLHCYTALWNKNIIKIFLYAFLVLCIFIPTGSETFLNLQFSQGKLHFGEIMFYKNC